MKVEYNLDVLKPHQPPNDMLARSLKNVKGVKYVCINIYKYNLKMKSSNT